MITIPLWQYYVGVCAVLWVVILCISGFLSWISKSRSPQPRGGYSPQVTPFPRDPRLQGYLETPGPVYTESVYDAKMDEMRAIYAQLGKKNPPFDRAINTVVTGQPWKRWIQELDVELVAARQELAERLKREDEQP